MELKLKENINTNSFVFKKRVIEETLSLLGDRNNYIENDVEFMSMISFVNNLVEDNIIIDVLGDNNIEQNIKEIVEPIFITQVMENEENYKIFSDIVRQTIMYLEREVLNNRHMSSIVHKLGELFADYTLEDLQKLISFVGEALIKESVAPIVQKQRVIQKVEKTETENKKLEELIKQFQKESDTK